MTSLCASKTTLCCFSGITLEGFVKDKFKNLQEKADKHYHTEDWPFVAGHEFLGFEFGVSDDLVTGGVPNRELKAYYKCNKKDIYKLRYNVPGNKDNTNRTCNVKKR